MRIRWLICGVLLLLGLLFVFCGCENEAGIPTDTAAVTMDASSQKPPRADGKVEMHYAVGTAGGGRIEGWSTQHGMPGEETEREVTAYAFPGYRFSHWSDGSEEENRRDVFGEGDTEITAYFVMERAELPIFMIDTATGRDVTSKDEYVGATVSLCNTGASSYEMSVLPAEIRGRGNATWGMEKKSYRLKFEDKQQPLGLGSGPSRSWVLMANHCDQSLMRNYLSIFMANRMDGIGFNSNGAMVEVYLNGKYHGVYLLCEQIQEGDYRINLGREEYPEKTPSDPGFLVELDMYAEGDYRFEINGHPYQAKSFVYSWKEFDYIKDYILRVEEAIYSGDKARVEEVLDLDSAVDGYILEEFFKNIDVGWSSFYMYKREGADEVLHLGPFWDFDLAAGNDMRLDNGDWHGISVAKKVGESSQ
ncbi:MAG: CotH kinase family protein, partial [Clostridia bacterium]|nr:CotH kinase family protein [Clostridia bacterium]